MLMCVQMRRFFPEHNRETARRVQEKERREISQMQIFVLIWKDTS